MLILFGIGIYFGNQHPECFTIVIQPNGTPDYSSIVDMNITVPIGTWSDDATQMRIKMKPEAITGEPLNYSCAEKIYPYYKIARTINWIGWPILIILIGFKYRKELKEITKDRNK
jgi:hypothetical protein